MTAPLPVRIFHLYPRHMNLYGDLGNVVTLVSRLRWRGLDAEVVPVDPGDHPDLSGADLLFMGGGQDRGQKLVATHLVELGGQIRELVSDGLPVLTICGGFQLFGHFFRTVDGDELPGISVFDGYTLGGTKRCIGNVVVDTAALFASRRAQGSGLEALFAGHPTTLVGFENHSGLTYLQGGTSTLGPVLVGFGNAGDGTGEGAIVHNAIGTYLHGPVLPKNPHLADFLLSAALHRRYGTDATLTALDDTAELRAHAAAIERARTARTSHLFQS